MIFEPPPKKPVLFVAIVFILLISYSFFSKFLPFSGSSNNNFISDITKEKNKPTPGSKQKTAIKLPKDTSKAAIPIRDYLTYNGIVTYEAERKFALHEFITALKELKAGKRKKMRIAYFGDSMIEGDLISQDLRQLLQNSFGGTGVGFVPVTSVVSGFKQTVVHSYSNWTDNTQANSTKIPLFLSGHSFAADTFSTVQYGVTALPHLQDFPEVYALYGKCAKPLQLTVNGSAHSLPATAVCNKALVATNCKLVKVRNVNSTPLYGFSFEDSVGIYIDNYAFRGSTGMDLAGLSSAFLKQLQQLHNYDLIIFQYGPNLLNPKVDDFTWYEKPMLTVVEKFKAGFPGASLLVVSTADKCYRYNGKMETAVGVEPLLDAQNNFAVAGGINLWNLYHAMGGRNSMLNWVEGDTAFARKDYTHFTSKGAEKIATMLFTAIMKEYALAK